MSDIQEDIFPKCYKYVNKYTIELQQIIPTWSRFNATILLQNKRHPLKWWIHLNFTKDLYQASTKTSPWLMGNAIPASRRSLWVQQHEGMMWWKMNQQWDQDCMVKAQTRSMRTMNGGFLGQQCMFAKQDASKHAKWWKQHNEHTYILVVDHSQNMEIPVFNQEQLQTTNYYSLLNIYNLGVVDHTDNAKQWLQSSQRKYTCSCIPQRSCNKGCKQHWPLIIKTMKMNGIIKNGDCRAELNTDFDNCPGLIKNNTVLMLVPYLVEMDYFKKVNFIGCWAN